MAILKDQIRQDNLQVSLLDVDDFVKKNNLVEITNPVIFDASSNPTSDGLLSNTIFGITKESRASTFAYISLKKKFLQPLVYRIWSKVDSKIKSVIHGIGTYSIDKSGNIVEDPKGDNGIDFLRKNIDKIKFRETDSIKRERYVKFLNDNRKNFFTDKLIVIPPFFRDIKVDGGKISVGDINKLYINVMVSASAIGDSTEYGFSIGKSVEGRLQEGLIEVYKWFGTGTDSNPNGGLPGKFGVIRRANLSKTTDYATRLVMSAPKLDVENMEDIRADFDYSVLPMTSAAANFFPFVIFHMRRFFENEFIGDTKYPILDKDGTIIYGEIEDYQIQFSDEVLKKELDRFIHGYSDRFRPVKVLCRVKGKQEYLDLKWKGFYKEPDVKALKNERPLTWCDVIYMACEEAVKDRMILITRYPIDTFYNEFATKIRLSSTIETEEAVFDNVVYTHYPKIRKEDIGKDTSSSFIDTMNICNGYLDSIGGDYDGDMVTIKGVYTDEANAELKKQLASNIHFINLGGNPVISTSKESIQALYAMTLTLPDTKLSPVKF
jgi:hypothetical protein|nr:MAG TPA: DNA-directed RNA polymerase II subunit [Caudoviricetes sp.]